MTKTKSSLVTLDQREATLGTKISTRSEVHGDERIPRKDISLATLIDKRELCALMREPLAAEALFDGAQPLFGGKIGPIAIEGVFEKCVLNVFVGIDLKEIEMHDVDVSAVRIEPLVGGMTRLSFKAQYHPIESDDVAILDNWLGQDVKLEMYLGRIKIEHEEQSELPMNVDAAA